jgi:hypothetical protein
MRLQAQTPNWYLLSVITTIQSQFSYGYMTCDITIVNEAGKRLAIEASRS